MHGFSETTLQCLREAGWHEGRVVRAGDIEHQLVGAGYHPGQLILKFLRQYAGLRIQHGHFDATQRDDWFHFDIKLALESVHPGTVTRFSRVLGVQLCLIGQAYRKYMALMMSDQGEVFAGYEDALVKVAPSGEDAIEAFCTIREMQQIPYPPSSRR